ncbi:MAG: hypothetical protein KDA87_02245 [Planctomycetales bacterium]|nr:hypothetical protein [Planctomycetales bacterium]
MNNSLLPNLLYAVGTLFQVMVLLGGIVYGLSHIGRYRKAAYLLIGGLSLILFSRIAAWVGILLISNLFSPSAEIFGIFNLAMSALNGFGLLLIILSVFADRGVRDLATEPDNHVFSPASHTVDSSNPYSTPQSE